MSADDVRRGRGLAGRLGDRLSRLGRTSIARLAAGVRGGLDGLSLGAGSVDGLVSVLRRRAYAAPLAEQPRLDAALEAARRADEHTLAYAIDAARSRLSLLRRFRPVEGARVLELGPGYSLVPGLLLHVHGAARYVGVDLFPVAYDGADFYLRLRAQLAAGPLVPVAGAEEATRAALARFDAAVDLTGERARFDERRVGMACPVDAARVPFPDGSFDVIVSNAAFEHFERPADAIRESFRLLAAGGVGLHQIDLRDHRDFSRPLEFLRESPAAWRRRHRHDMFNYTNRWRRGDYARAFTAAGFEVLEVEVNLRAPFDEALRGRLHPDFAALPREELEALGVHLAVRRPAGSGE